MKSVQTVRTVQRLKLIVGLVVVCICTDALATEIYSWVDKDGVHHFSDSVPAVEHEVKNIDLPDQAPPEPASGSVPLPTGNEEDAPLTAAQTIRKKIDDDRAERKKAKAELAQLCPRYRDRLARMEPGRRVFYTDEQGEMVRLDDDQRIGMVNEAREFIVKNCG